MIVINNVAYVNAEIGNDSTGMVGNQNAKYKSIEAALNACNIVNSASCKVVVESVSVQNIQVGHLNLIRPTVLFLQHQVAPIIINDITYNAGNTLSIVSEGFKNDVELSLNNPILSRLGIKIKGIKLSTTELYLANFSSLELLDSDVIYNEITLSTNSIFKIRNSGLICSTSRAILIDSSCNCDLVNSFIIAGLYSVDSPNIAPIRVVNTISNCPLSSNITSIVGSLTVAPTLTTLF